MQSNHRGTAPAGSARRKAARGGRAVALCGAALGLAACAAEPASDVRVPLPHGLTAPQWVQPVYPPPRPVCYGVMDGHRQLQIAQCPD